MCVALRASEKWFIFPRRDATVSALEVPATPTPESLNLKPYVLNPRPYTLNP